MTLFSLARKNMKQNFKNYFLYFASMIFSIVIYFTFVSLKYDQTIQERAESSAKISSAFSGAAFILIIFVAVFIWYSNSFFTRKRKKEVGLYSLLGVRKKQIGRLLFYENLIMGLFALLVGIGTGAITAKFFVALLMKVMGYEALAGFSLSPAAVINTLIVFFIIILMTSFQGYRLIYRFQLIELFQADQEGERQPKASLLLALLSVVLIGTGYWVALQNMFTSNVWKNLGIMMTPMVILATVIAGTYFLFSTFTVYALKTLGNNKKRDWKGMNIVGRSQLLYRIKGNARTLTIIAVLSATTLTAVCTAYSFYYSNRETVQSIDPNSMMFIRLEDETAQKVNATIAANKDHQVLHHQTVAALQLDANTEKLNDRFSATERTYSVINNQAFNQLAQQQGRNDSFSLHGHEAVILDAGYMEQFSPKYIHQSVDLKVNGREETVTFKDFKTYNVLNIETAGTVVVVGDGLFSKLAAEVRPVSMELYRISKQEKAKQLTEDVEVLLTEEALFSSYYTDFSSVMESTGLMIFMAGFLGLVFLAATGSIIYFKQVTEATADKGRYHILYKIGVSKREIKKTIAKQTAFVFALPLFIGIIHCGVALTALSNLLQTNLVMPVVICVSSYTAIYLLYYIFTVRSYYKIVTNTK